VAKGQTQVILTVKQLGDAEGSIFVSVTGAGLNESTLIEKTFTKVGE
jgi:hypothetical protein